MAITFKSVLASGGSGATITVTYSSEFYNQTLTATNGTDTVTALATSAGTVDITVPSAGSWVVSCTISGETYTSDTVSVDLSYSTELVAIPDGATVTPTDDVQTWLKCAGIKDKNYTTLSQVLADSVTFNALLGDSNACAYMARCETWASELVPTMTSNTTPSGTASASAYYDAGSQAYMAFDGSTSTAWSVADSITNAWVQYEFPVAQTVKSFKIVAANGRLGQYKIQGSNDGFISDVNDIFSDTNTSTGSGLIIVTDAITSPASYKYYRLHVLATADGHGVYMNEFQLYANPDSMALTDNQYAMSMIGQYDVCCDALLGNATWASAITSSAYCDYVLKGTVPIMTSDTTPSGTCVGNPGTQTAYPAYKAFDGTSAMWFGDSNGALPRTNEWVGYLYPTDVEAIVTKYYVNFEQATACTHKLQGYDGTNWVDVDASTSTVLNGTITVSNSTKYKGYRVYIISQNLPNTQYAGGRVQYCQFYGRRTDGTEKIHGTTNESAYYLDNGTEVAIVDPSTLSAGTYTFGSTVAKDPSDLTADYRKQIRITPNTVEVVLRPDKSIYWYGSKVQSMVFRTGGGSYTFVNGTLTNNTNSITVTLPASTASRQTSYVSEQSVSGGTVKVVVKSATVAAYSSASIVQHISYTNGTTKVSGGSICYSSAVTTPTLFSDTYAQENAQVGIYIQDNGNNNLNNKCEISALWRE